MFAVPVVIESTMRCDDLVQQPLVEWHDTWQRKANAMADDRSVSGVAP